MDLDNFFIPTIEELFSEDVNRQFEELQQLCNQYNLKPRTYFSSNGVWYHGTIKVKRPRTVRIRRLVSFGNEYESKQNYEYTTQQVIKDFHLAETKKPR